MLFPHWHLSLLHWYHLMIPLLPQPKRLHLSPGSKMLLMIPSLHLGYILLEVRMIPFKYSLLTSLGLRSLLSERGKVSSCLITTSRNLGTCGAGPQRPSASAIKQKKMDLQQQWLAREKLIHSIVTQMKKTPALISLFDVLRHRQGQPSSMLSPRWPLIVEKKRFCFLLSHWSGGSAESGSYVGLESQRVHYSWWTN